MRDHDIETIDRLGKRRAVIATLLGFFFMASQMNRLGALQAGRTLDLLGWAAFSLGMVLFVVFGSGLWRGRRVRAMLNDESTAANRHRALISGFWAMLLASAAAYFRTYLEPLSPREALHSVVTLGVGMAIINFGVLEWQAHKG